MTCVVLNVYLCLSIGMQQVQHVVNAFVLPILSLSLRIACHSILN